MVGQHMCHSIRLKNTAEVTSMLAMADWRFFGARDGDNILYIIRVNESTRSVPRVG